MKALFTSLLAVICVVILVFGNLHWNNKTTNAVDKTTVAPVKETAKPAAEKLTDLSKEQLLSLAANWPEESKNTLGKAFDEGRSFKIVAAGSEVLGEDHSQWGNIIEEKIQGSFGDMVSFTVKGYPKTSAEFVEEGLAAEISSENPDMVILEPFTLNDNGMVVIEESLENITGIIEEVKQDNPSAVFVLQPPYPLYNANFYPVQVDALKKYAEDNGFVYLDHWAEWPDYRTEEIKQYFVEDLSEPNDEGIGLWAGFISDYLVNN